MEREFGKDGRNPSGKCRLLGRRAKLAAGAICAAFATPLIAGSPDLAPIQIAAPPIIRATPALWEIRDSDTIIYLFGTFHSLDGRTVWFTDEVRSAFDRSSELVLETIVPDGGQISTAAGDSVTQTSPDGSKKLSPFIAQTRTVVDHGRAIGLSVEHGADAVLRRVAENDGKRVAGLETFTEQLRTLSRIPAAPPVASAVAAPSSEAVSVSLNQLLDAWKGGDTAAFSTMLAGFEAKAPTAYRMLISDRNARWGQWIADRMQQPGTIFVAVGSGHLAGKDSVQTWLASRGIAAYRVY